MRIPTFSRQSDATETAEAERPASVSTTTTTTPVRARQDETTADLKTVPAAPVARPRVDTPPPVAVRRAEIGRSEADRAAKVDRTGTATVIEKPVERPVDRKPRASMLAMFGLIFSVVSALLVLSGPLLGYGIGVAVLALVLSLGGLHATGKRHVAGKGDALIGIVLSLGAIVIGILALTGSLAWLGTNMHPVDSLRQWLDTQFVDRF